MVGQVSDSEFSMWRAVFAFSVLDREMSLEEQKLLQSYRNKVDFSQEQLKVISSDFKSPQDIEKLYRGITKPDDKKRFCILARAMVWSDGEIDGQEAEILKRVACLKEPAENEILMATRGHGDLPHYYQQYARAGVVGLFNLPPQLDMVS